MQTAISPQITPITRDNLKGAIAEALKRIAPLWPIEHFVAVNPFLGLVDRPFESACAILRRTLGRSPVQAPEEYLALWRSGEITSADLACHTDTNWTAARLLEVLDHCGNYPVQEQVSTFADVLDLTLPRPRWSRFVTEEIAKWCAVHFDRNQTTWVSPWRHLGLFAAWKAAAVHDAKPEAFGLPGFRRFVRELPDDPLAVIRRAWFLLRPQGYDAADFLHRELATISGWAGHVQYLVREDAMRGNENPALMELLAIRLAYDTALHEAFGSEPRVARVWHDMQIPVATTPLDEALARWQSAYETGYQRKLLGQLALQPATMPRTRPSVQAVFCIDVRSEIVRRHLERLLPGSHTLGFAGFFGFPVAHQPAHACKPAARCPALLVPPIVSREARPPQAGRDLFDKRARKAFQISAASCFTFVESLGLAFAAGLIRAHDRKSCPGPSPAPIIDSVSAEQKATMAEGALRGMSLIRNFARIVLLCGHGSHSANNPFASSLDCGACGGHAGDVNARLAASTLNDPEIRAILAQRGIEIPNDTLFLAGRHDTLSDDFLLYETESAQASHCAEIATLQSALSAAGAAARAERAPRLGLGHLSTGAALDRAVRRRGTDLAQLRPEWALANNAALIAAPRSRTAALELEGRVFLHEYDPVADPGSKILALILTAPVVVASWINLQYYGSRTDPEDYAAGNKAIHQVVGGLGVIEGNAGDLRSGLPMQSIHNGEKFVHEPRRLTVIIENTPERIDEVLDAHPAVRQLFDHQWLGLFAIVGNTTWRRRAVGDWR